MIIINHTGELVEALGIREALSWLKNKEYVGVVVETDCGSGNLAVTLSYLGRVIKDYKSLLV